eukprot:ANDGO_03282.mRNA.1 CDK5RAP1-like protein
MMMIMRGRSVFRRFAHKDTLEALRKSQVSLRDFMAKDGADAGEVQRSEEERHYLDASLCAADPSRSKVYIETYGCQMNSADSEIVLSIMQKAGYTRVDAAEDASVVFLNTCAIRENAEDKVWRRLESLKKVRAKNGTVVGVLGCMAERLKTSLLEHRQLLDVVCGPDAYRDLPRLVSQRQDAINVMLSADETYADIAPVRLDASKRAAFCSIMRGCANMCSYCVVPFTRGRERSRPVESIEQEIRLLAEQGVREVTLLGQNVNSYVFRPGHESNSLDGQSVQGVQGVQGSSDSTGSAGSAGSRPFEETAEQLMAKGFRSIVKVQPGGIRFADLLDRVARIDPEMRIRFTSPHPKDFPDPVLDVIQNHANICKSIHIPAQSGSNAVLESMRRGYTREAYLELIDHMRSKVTNVALSSDFISGFCGETEDDHLQTLDLLKRVQYDYAFMFAYSMRERTYAHRKLNDDVPEDVKMRRLAEVIATFHDVARQKHFRRIGTTELVLVENPSKRNSNVDVTGRGDCNMRVHFPAASVPIATRTELQKLLCGENIASQLPKCDADTGDYVAVKIVGATSTSLRGIPVARTSLQDYHACISLRHQSTQMVI